MLNLKSRTSAFFALVIVLAVAGIPGDSSSIVVALDRPTVVSSWLITTPSIDGTISDTEWEYATRVNISSDGKTADAYFKNDADYLYVAIDAVFDGEFHGGPSPWDEISITFDAGNDGDLDDTANVRVSFGKMAQKGVAEALSLYGTCDSRLLAVGQGAVDDASGHVQYELRIPLVLVYGESLGMVIDVGNQCAPGGCVSRLWYPGDAVVPMYYEFDCNGADPIVQTWAILELSPGPSEICGPVGTVECFGWEVPVLTDCTTGIRYGLELEGLPEDAWGLQLYDPSITSGDCFWWVEGVSGYRSIDDCGGCDCMTHKFGGHVEYVTDAVSPDGTAYIKLVFDKIERVDRGSDISVDDKEVHVAVFGAPEDWLPLDSSTVEVIAHRETWDSEKVFVVSNMDHYIVTQPADDSKCRESVVARVAWKSKLDLSKLKAGDILMEEYNADWTWVIRSWYRGYWGHTAIYDGEHWVLEAIEPSVVRRRIDKTAFFSAVDWIVLRPQRDYVSDALLYGAGRIGTPFGTPLPTGFASKSSDASFYCSLFAWRSYKEGGLDLDTAWAFQSCTDLWLGPQPWCLVLYNQVPTDNIYYFDENSLATVAEHGDGHPKRGALWLASAAHLYVTDPLGRHAGVDPSTGQVVQESPLVSYYSGPPVEGEQYEYMTIRDMEGIWNVQVVGTETGEYSLSIDMPSRNEDIPSQLVTGQTEAGQVNNYRLVYPTDPGTSDPLVPTDQPCSIPDFNLSGKVDIQDVGEVASRWRTSCQNPDPDDNPATPNYGYDLDGDCIITVVDIMKVVKHWGERCTDGEEEDCVPDSTLACGNSDSRNNSDAGSTDRIDTYSCIGWNESGPEYAYEFTPSASSQVAVSLNNLSADLDLFVLAPGCNATDCLVHGDLVASFDAAAGQTYYIVVDGYQGAVSDYTISLDCLDGGCVPDMTLDCGGGDSWNNGGLGSTDLIDSYSCTSWNESGPEYAYAFVPSVSGQVDVSLSNLGADLDLFIVAPGCNPTNCLTHGDTTASFNAIAGQLYYVVVDGYQGAVSDYTINVSCAAAAQDQSDQEPSKSPWRFNFIPTVVPGVATPHPTTNPSKH